MISIIVAMSRNRVIGRGGSIPWQVPADLARFRRLTVGHSLIMGRKTFESIGRPLAERNNIVVSRQPGYSPPGVLLAASFEEALQLAGSGGEVFVCGGEAIYSLALPVAARIYLTRIDLEVAGDRHFPPLPPGVFVEIFRERLADNPPADFIILERTPLSGGGLEG